MNFGSSVLHIVVQPVTDCCRKVSSEDTIEQLLMVHIVECSCQIEREEHFNSDHHPESWTMEASGIKLSRM